MTLAHQKAAAQRAREAKKAASRNNIHSKNMTTPTPVINAGDSDVDEDLDPFSTEPVIQKCLPFEGANLTHYQFFFSFNFALQFCEIK
jgi:hypothetical protein